MFWEVLLATLGSIGGATVVVGALSLFLSRVWAERIKHAAIAKFEMQFETLKAANVKALEEFRSNNVKELEHFRAKSTSALKERETFSSFSATFYQGFFEKRVAVYQKMLSLINVYTKNMREEFLTEELETWHEHYVSAYKSFRDCVTKNQLYISNQAEVAFKNLRTAIAPYLAAADREESMSIGSVDDMNDIEALHEIRRKHEDEAHRETNHLMAEFIDQIQKDVAMMRSRIEMDAPI